MKTLGLAGVLLVFVAGCGAWNSSPQPLAASAKFGLFALSPVKTADMKQATDPSSGKPIFLVTPPIVSAADMAAVEQSTGADGQPALTVYMTPAGAKTLAAATAKLQGQQIALVINNKVIATPKLIAPLSESFQITGQFSREEGEQLFTSLTE